MGEEKSKVKMGVLLKSIPGWVELANLANQTMSAGKATRDSGAYLIGAEIVECMEKIIVSEVTEEVEKEAKEYVALEEARKRGMKEASE